MLNMAVQFVVRKPRTCEIIEIPGMHKIEIWQTSEEVVHGIRHKNYE